jgi:hypothetical protein
LDQEFGTGRIARQLALTRLEVDVADQHYDHRRNRCWPVQQKYKLQTQQGQFGGGIFLRGVRHKPDVFYGSVSLTSFVSLNSFIAFGALPDHHQRGPYPRLGLRAWQTARMTNDRHARIYGLKSI